MKQKYDRIKIQDAQRVVCLKQELEALYKFEHAAFNHWQAIKARLSKIGIEIEDIKNANR